MSGERDGSVFEPKRLAQVDVWRLPDSVFPHEAEVTFWDDADTDECVGINPTVKWFRYKHLVREEVTMHTDDSILNFEVSGLMDHYFPEDPFTNDKED